MDMLSRFIPVKIYPADLKDAPDAVVSQGPKGNDGRDGTKGNDGERGPPGENGRDGERGPPGENGRDGERGPPGENGRDGERGPPGERGNDGRDGERGPPGERGNDGRDGERGPPGEKGNDGERGSPGETHDGCFVELGLSFPIEGSELPSIVPLEIVESNQWDEWDVIPTTGIYDIHYVIPPNATGYISIDGSPIDRKGCRFFQRLHEGQTISMCCNFEGVMDTCSLFLVRIL
jgi:hypothetical protein